MHFTFSNRFAIRSFLTDNDVAAAFSNRSANPCAPRAHAASRAYKKQKNKNKHAVLTSLRGGRKTE